MSITVEHPAASDLRDRREKLLAQMGQSYEELAELARKYMLTSDEIVVWDEIEAIDFLLGDE